MAFETAIAEALLAGNQDEIDAAMDRETLKYAVQRVIFCPLSEVVLDIRTAVYIEITMADGTSGGSSVFDGKAWDEVYAEKMPALCAEKGITLKVVDGRIVNAPKAKPRRPRTPRA